MFRGKTFVRSWLVLFLLAGSLAGALAPTLLAVRAAPRAQAATNVVISEFRTQGPSGGNDEFIELYNPTSSAIDISGWEIWGSNNAASTSRRAIIPSTLPLQPGQHYLIANTASSGYSGSVSYDFNYSVGVTNDGGIALIRPDIPTPTIIDQVGMSNGSAYKEGTPLAPLTTNVDRGYERKYGGSGGSCIDGNDNLLDFQLISPSDPQNSTSIVPCYVSPIEVLINEVAWAGTLASPDDEWIELYNPGSLDINLTGWRLLTDSGSVDVILNGTIQAGGFFLLERAHDNTVSDVAADQIYFGILSDSGEALRLRKPDGSVVDTANSDGGAWPAGSASPNGSMERMGVIPDAPLAWVTNVDNTSWTRHDAFGNLIHGTPGGSNWGFGVTHTPTPSNTPSPTPSYTPTPTDTPTPAGSLTLLINEVAWMGTLASSSDEWIELYNPGSLDINLSGWHLNAADGSPAISLTGTISAGGYFLIAASSSVFSDLSPQMTFSGSLSNEGEVLRLLDPSGAIVDTANSDSGAWPAGVASPTYASMERRGVLADGFFSWSTYANPSPPPYPNPVIHDRNGNPVKGTPGQANWGPIVTLTPTATATPTRTKTPTRTPTRVPTHKPVARVVINEFLPRAGFDWNNDGVIDVYDEFIEVENLGPIDVDLKNWKLDDEPLRGSDQFSLPSKKLRPGERAVFYGSMTHILLDDSGDTVRLINPSGIVMDARTYTAIKYPDQSHCRMPDGFVYWKFPCFPTPGTENTLTGTLPSTPPETVNHQPPACLFADTTPEEFKQAECNSFGADVWNRKYWDDQAGQDEFVVPDLLNKWPTTVE